jgi:hypothetical protein
MKKTKIQTPFGRAGFCRLIRPSFKFKKGGEFNAQIILSPEDAAPLIEKLDALYEEAYQENLEAERAKRKQPKLEIDRAKKPYRNMIDEDTGEPLPEILFNARMAFRRLGQDENGVERVFSEARPQVQDSRLNPVRQEVGAGSTIRLQFLVNGFYTAALGSGLSLQLVGVQVKHLVPVGSVEADFEELEDGFVETLASDVVEVTHAPEEPVVTESSETPSGSEW